MNPKVERLIAEKMRSSDMKTRRSIQEDKSRLATKFALYGDMRRLGPNDPLEAYENAETEWDEENQEYVYYAKMPLELSDEEYESLKRLEESETQDSNDDGELGYLTGRALQFIAIAIYILVFISGIVSGVSMNFDVFNESVNVNFSWGAALVVWVMTFVSGTVILGFAKVVQLLSAIYGEVKAK